MRKFVAQLFVPVALLCTVSPALASGPKSATTSSDIGNIAYSDSGRAYAIDSNAQALTNLPAASKNARPVRHILLTGARPIGAFGDNSARLASADR